MGCSTSTVAEHADTLREVPPNGVSSVTLQDEAGLVRKHGSVRYLEPQASFHSMECTPTVGGPPVAATHQGHVERLNRFLRRVNQHGPVLRREVRHRRGEM
mmetsp:Transcript_8223/g.19600  ORF Transcript_8223/g.19600 Transcript_8223/m.19600 type:complete len:101 (+) Transcript_8223:39-341(+)